MSTDTTRPLGVIPTVLLLATFSASCAGPPVQRTRIPAVDQIDWYRFRLEAIPCSVELPGKPSYYSCRHDGRMAQCKAFFSFFDVQPPPGVLADAVSLLTLSIESYTTDQFARLEAYLRESNLYLQSDASVRQELLWHVAEHPEVDTMRSEGYVYARRTLRTGSGVIITCKAELRTPALLPIAKRILESAQLTNDPTSAPVPVAPQAGNP